MKKLITMNINHRTFGTVTETTTREKYTNELDQTYYFVEIATETKTDETIKNTNTSFRFDNARSSLAFYKNCVESFVTSRHVEIER